MKKEEIYQKILKEAESDQNVIGFVLGAGRGKGFATEYSDYDIIIIVPDEKISEYEKKYESFNSTEIIEAHVRSLSQFKEYANWGGVDAGHQYNFVYLKAQIDRTGEIQKIIDEKSVIPADKVKEFVSGELDKYINFYYRSVKNFRDKNLVASHLDGAESVFALLSAVFGLEGRLRPYNKFLEWELKTRPLKLLPWNGDEFLEKITKIIQTGDVATQKEILNKIFELFRQHGYGAVIDGWNGYYLG